MCFPQDDDRFKTASILREIEEHKKRMDELNTMLNPSPPIVKPKITPPPIQTYRHEIVPEDYRHNAAIDMAKSLNTPSMYRHDVGMSGATSIGIRGNVGPGPCDPGWTQATLIEEREEENMKEKSTFGFKDALLMILIGWLVSKLVNSWSGDALKGFWEAHKAELKNFLKV